MNRRHFILTTSIASAATMLNYSSRAEDAQNEVVLNIEPTKENPRNSEGAFITLKTGRILFCYTRFYGGSGDGSAAKIESIFSDDGGRTWSKDRKVIIDPGSDANVMSVSLLRLQSGKIALFYLVKNSLLDCRPVIRVSQDETESWSEPVPLTKGPGYFVLNNDRVIQLTSGRLVAPLALHRSRGDDPKSYKQWDSRAIDVWCLSDDEGKTWREADDWWALAARTTSGLQEPGVVELADGKLFSWARTDQGAQFGSISTDSGVRWSMPKKTSLESPVSPASIKRVPGSADLLALYNDHSGRFEFPKGRRSPLTLAISSDGGNTWPRVRLIESDLEGWYCYTAIHFTEDALLLAYCAGDKKIGNLNRIRLRRISLGWIKSL